MIGVLRFGGVMSELLTGKDENYALRDLQVWIYKT